MSRREPRIQVIHDGQDPHQRTISVVPFSGPSAIQRFRTALVSHDRLTGSDSAIKADSIGSEGALLTPVDEILHDPIIIGISDGAIRIICSNLPFQYQVANSGVRLQIQLNERKVSICNRWMAPSCIKCQVTNILVVLSVRLQIY